MQEKVLTLIYSPPTQEVDIDLPRFRAKSGAVVVLGSVWVMAPTKFAALTG